MVNLRDKIQISTIYHVQSLVPRLIMSLASPSSYVPPTSLSWPTWGLCMAPCLSSTTCQPILVNCHSLRQSSRCPVFLFSATVSLWLFFFLLISCMLSRPWASDHLSGLVGANCSSWRINRCPRINHKLSKTKNSQVPSSNMVQNKDGAIDNYWSNTCSYLLTSLVWFLGL